MNKLIVMLVLCSFPVWSYAGDISHADSTGPNFGVSAVLGIIVFVVGYGFVRLVEDDGKPKSYRP